MKFSLPSTCPIFIKHNRLVFFIMRVRDQQIKRIKRLTKAYINSERVKFYWTLYPLPNAQQPKEKQKTKNKTRTK